MAHSVSLPCLPVQQTASAFASLASEHLQMHFAPDPATEKKNKSNKNEITCCFSYILKVSSSLLLAGSYFHDHFLFPGGTQTKLTKEIVRPHLVAAVVAVDLQSSGTTTARTSHKPANCQFSNYYHLVLAINFQYIPKVSLKQTTTS